MSVMIVGLLSVAQCDLCGTTEPHVSSPATGTTSDSLTAAGWRLYTAENAPEDPDGNRIDALCPRCAPVMSG